MGNLSAVTDANALTRTYGYDYDAQNRLLTAQTGADDWQYAYDAAGNRTAMTTTYDSQLITTLYTYDNASHLTSIQLPASSIQSTWDARGNLLSDGVFTYTYDGANRMVGATSLTTTAVYTYNGDGLERIGVQQGDAWSYPLSDALGFVRQWTNARGGGSNPLYYDPFGVPLPQPNTPSSPLGYTGEWTDAVTGLQYLRAR